MVVNMSSAFRRASHLSSGPALVLAQGVRADSDQAGESLSTWRGSTAWNGSGGSVWSSLRRWSAPSRSGWLVAAAGAALLAGSLPLPRAGSDVLFTLGIAAALAAPGLAGAAALTYVP